MTEHVEVRRGAYHDSVTLMEVSRAVAAADGVAAAQVAMATELNVEVIEGMGFTVPEVGPNDLLVAIRGDDEAAIGAGLSALESALAGRQAASTGDGGLGAAPAPRSVGRAIRRGAANLALVSVPGPHATVEALDAVGAGASVMVFSDNVPVEDEVLLKDAAVAADVLVMGPDCGTAVVGGVALGFANAVRPGVVGLVAASGTGAQQVMCLLDAAGVGISHCLGLGGRDLSAAVAGRSARQALASLAADPRTEWAMVVSKPPAPEVLTDLKSYAAGLGLRVHWATLGPDEPDLTAAVESGLTAEGHPVPEWPSWLPMASPNQQSSEDRVSPASTDLPKTRSTPDAVEGSSVTSVGGVGTSLRGLFCGGTLADEAMLIAADTLGPVYSNIPLSPELALGPDLASHGHTVIDFGDDTLTRGRAHPMIDPTLRLERLAAEARDPECGVLLLDLVLGYGAHPDPAPDLAEAIAAARATARSEDRELPVVVSLTGVDADPQRLMRSAEMLREVGAAVFLSNARAARHALALLRRATTGTERQYGGPPLQPAARSSAAGSDATRSKAAGDQEAIGGGATAPVASGRKASAGEASAGAASAGEASAGEASAGEVTEAARAAPGIPLHGLLSAEPVVATAGVTLLADALRAQAVAVTEADWHPPLPGTERDLVSVAADPRRAEANARAFARMTEAGADLVDVRPASEALGLEQGTFLHAGPPLEWERASGPMRGALVGAMLLEELADTPEEAEEKLAKRDGITLEPCHHRDAVAPMAGVVSRSMWVYELRDEVHGGTSWCTLNEGLGKVLRYGAYGPEVIDRLRWMNAVLGPLLRQAIRARGPVDITAVIAQMLQMGDEGHNRNRAGSLLLLRELLPALIAADAPGSDIAEAVRFSGANEHFFLNLGMPACKLATMAAHGIPGSSVVTTMARNGTDFGIRVSGTGDEWFTAPANTPEGLYLGAYGPQDANPDIGDSAITETAGIGGFAMAAAPAIVRFVGGDVPFALRTTQTMYEITLGEHPAYQVPILEFRGTPTGIDVVAVARTGILPQINTGMAGRVAGTGQVGAGLVRPPEQCFTAALRALAERWNDAKSCVGGSAV